jgi:hypothetical protein
VVEIWRFVPISSPNLTSRLFEIGQQPTTIIANFNYKAYNLVGDATLIRVKPFMNLLRKSFLIFTRISAKDSMLFLQ